MPDGGLAALIHTTADATRRGVIDASVAGRTAEQLIGELWASRG